jgi:hypothetical protein
MQCGGSFVLPLVSFGHRGDALAEGRALLALDVFLALVLAVLALALALARGPGVAGLCSRPRLFSGAPCGDWAMPGMLRGEEGDRRGDLAGQVHVASMRGLRGVIHEGEPEPLRKV